MERTCAFTLLAAVLLLAGCVYRMPIQQGNFLDEKTIAQVKPGMTRLQVEFLLGRPVLETPFDADSAYYVYYLDVKNDTGDKRNVFVIHYEGATVTRVETGPAGAVALEQPTAP